MQCALAPLSLVQVKSSFLGLLTPTDFASKLIPLSTYLQEINAVC